MATETLGNHFLSGKPFFEHHAYYYPAEQIDENTLPVLPGPVLFRNKADCICFAVNSDRTVNNSYYIGIDWLVENQKAVYVQPKLNQDGNRQVNYLAMLFDALKHPDVFEHTGNLFEIKWDKPTIRIEQQHDLLMPLLVVQYLQVVKSIVRKGLKKSYYQVTHNLHGRVKGKILVAQNIKQNLTKSKILDTFCAFEEFGLDGIENRILKKVLLFVQQYLAVHRNLNANAFIAETFHYIMPAFHQVSSEASLEECRHSKTNPFYKEYRLAIDMAKLILRRFSYNINNAAAHDITTPPYWIDMSKLFELYVLGLLKDCYKNAGTVEYHVATRGNELDILLNAGNLQMVIDVKYKLKYQGNGVNHEDVRQVSGYARLKKVYDKLSKKNHEAIDCLIIYPKQEPLLENEEQVIDLNQKELIDGYVGVYKYGVKLP